MPKKKEVKKEAKKTMKKTPDAVAPKDNKAVRELINKVLVKNKGLIVTENAHGAVQVRRNVDTGSDLLFSARKNGCFIITHPMYDGKERIYKHKGNAWDHLSEVPNDSVSLKMLADRIKDPKTRKQYHDEIYKGANKKKSGLAIKAASAKALAEKVEKETGKKVKATTVKRTAVKRAKGKVTGKRGKALRKVSRKAAATA